MNIKKLLLLAVIPMMCLTVSAQEAGSKTDFAPQKGDFTFALTLGYNNYASIKAMPMLQNFYEAEAQSTNWADKKLMVGFEAGWFFKDLWKLSLGGGLNFTSNPGYTGSPGTVTSPTIADVYDNIGEIPYYLSTANATTFSYMLSVGVDRYFKLNAVKNLMPYVGGRIGYAYGKNVQKYDEPFSAGKSKAETFNLRAAVTIGVDYFILPAFYIGAQIDPLAYTYNMANYVPQPGLGKLGADSHNFSLLAAPTIKIGFKIGKSNKGKSAYNDNSDELNRIANELRAIRENQPKEVIHVDTVKVPADCPPQKSEGLRSHVTFTIGTSNVTNLEEMNILAVAEYMKKNPEAKAKIYGYADNGTGNQETNHRLAKQRADAVAKVLTDKYGISSSRVEINSMQGTEQAFETNNWNRVVVITANE